MMMSLMKLVKVSRKEQLTKFTILLLKSNFFKSKVQDGVTKIGISSIMMLILSMKLITLMQEVKLKTLI